MKKHVLPTLFLAAGALVWGVAHAEKADRNKPMNIEADALRYDDLKQTSVFTGSVVLTKGTIIIRGARVDVRQDPEGYQFGVVTAEPGKLAYYRQKRDNLDEYIEGEGEVIEYDSKADNVKFIRRAELRRFRGATVNDEMTGNVITYDNGTDVFTINGVPTTPGASTAVTPGGRVRAMLTPRGAAAAPAGTVPGATATPAQATPVAPAATVPGVPLRSSTTLSGDKK
jgi:lipopolysaccharide export system protein LptA